MELRDMEFSWHWIWWLQYSKILCCTVW